MNLVLRALIVAALFALLAGCSTTRAADPNAVGRDGWVKADLEPGKTVHVQDGLKAIWVIKSDQGANEYEVRVKPAGGIAPVYPGAQLLRGKSYIYREDRIYSIPEGKTFQDVYDWYIDWFAFGKSQK